MNRKEIIEELNQIGFYIYQIKNDKENTDLFLPVLEIRVQSLLNKLNDEA
jgi:hypothetical protein